MGIVAVGLSSDKEGHFQAGKRVLVFRDISDFWSDGVCKCQAEGQSQQKLNRCSPARDRRKERFMTFPDSRPCGVILGPSFRIPVRLTPKGETQLRRIPPPMPHDPASPSMSPTVVRKNTSFPKTISLRSQKSIRLLRFHECSAFCVLALWQTVRQISKSSQPDRWCI
jgi:hypothetical protein